MKNIPQAFEFEDKCQECGSSYFIHDYDSGETICGNCGLVTYDQKIAVGLKGEPRVYNTPEGELIKRTGAPEDISIHDRGLSTFIDFRDKDIFNQKIPDRYQMRRLRKWQIQNRVQSAIERNLARAMSEIDRITDNLSLPKTYNDQAAYTYREAVSEKLIRGRSIKAMAAACVYIACRIKGNPRTLEEITKASGKVSKKDISRCVRLLLNNLDNPFSPDNPSNYLNPLTHIEKIATNAGVFAKSRLGAKKIIQQIREIEATTGKDPTAGKDPLSIAAAALYIACKLSGKKKTQKEIADAAGVTEVTVRNREKELKKSLGIKFPDEPIEQPIVVTFQTYQDQIIETVQKADLSQKIQEEALKILQQIKGSELLQSKGNKDLAGVTSAILYEAGKRTGEKKSQEVIAKAAGVNQMTLWTRWKKLKLIQSKKEKELELSQPIWKRSEEQIVSTLSFLLLNYFIFANILK